MRISRVSPRSGVSGVVLRGAPMSWRLLTDGVWDHLTKATAASRKPAYVAVAYFGSGGAKILPLPPGSVLVVDASEATVRSGQTNPSELIKLYRTGVKIHSYEGLHAKVYVLGNAVFVGSANVSKNSRDRLREAVSRSSAESDVRAARVFVQSLMTLELGVGELRKLASMCDKRRRSRTRGGIQTRVRKPKVFVNHFQFGELSNDEAGRESLGADTARSLLRSTKRHEVSSYWYNKSSTPSWRRGDTLLPVELDDSGNVVRIYPPERVLMKREGLRLRFFYVETDVRLPTMTFQRARLKLSRSAAKALCQDGIVRDQRMLNELIKLFQV